MVLVKNVKFGHVFIFRKISQKCVWQYFRNKKYFQDYKNKKLKKWNKLGFFPKELDHGFGQKCEIGPSMFLFFAK